MKRGILELLVSPRRAKKNPWLLGGLAFVFVSTGIFVNMMVPVIAGAEIVFAMVPAIPLIWSLIVREEKEEEERIKLLPKNSLAYHLPLIEVFAFFFLGATIAYTFWFTVLPPEQSQHIFSSQLQEIRNIGLTVGKAIDFGFAGQLFEHNLVVLGFMLAFSLIYGIGSVYLLLWNASIIGVFIGTKLQAGGMSALLGGIIGIFPHGVFELGAYFIASIGGGMLSTAIMHRHTGKPQFKLIISDIVTLLIVSLVMLGIAAVLESS